MTARAKQPHGTGDTPGGEYVLRLYITGSTPRSVRAIENIRAVCEGHLEGRYTLQVIDIYQQPDAVVADQILASPTLIKELPAPLRRLVGDLSDENKVLAGLNIQRTP